MSRLGRTVVPALSLAVALSAVVLMPRPCRADDRAEAHRLFRQGYARLMQGSFPEARDLLRRSLERYPRPATAFDLVLALVGTEEPLDAAGICTRLLSDGYGHIGGQQRTDAERECRRARDQVGTVVVEVRGASRVTLHLDGEDVAGPAGAGSAARAVHVNPGAHVLSATSDDGRSVEERVQVPRGQTVRISLALAAVAASVPGTSSPGHEPLWQKPWLWVAVGVVVAGAAVATVAVVSSRSGGPQVMSDPVFGVTHALR